MCKRGISVQHIKVIRVACKGATRGEGLRGLKPSFARSKLRKKIRIFNF